MDIFCGAFLESAPAPTSNSVIQIQNNMAISTDVVTLVPLKDLRSSSCTASPNPWKGLSLSVEHAVLVRGEHRTDCCKEVVIVRLATDTVIADSTTMAFGTVTVDFALSDVIQLLLTIETVFFNSSCGVLLIILILARS